MHLLRATLVSASIVFAVSQAEITIANEPSKPAVKPTTFYVDDPVKWATPKEVLPPQYPKEALEKGVTAVVEATLNLKATGKLDSIISIQSAPAMEAFEKSVVDVLKHWTFAESFDPDCRPVPALSRVKVWFDLIEGKPSISVTHVQAAPVQGTAAVRELNRPEVMAALLELFPGEARRQGKSANVYARLSVNPLSGQTEDVNIVTLVGEPSIFQRETGASLRAGNRSETFAAQFGGATFQALKKSRFDPSIVHGDGLVRVCRSVRFRVSDREEDR